MQRHYGRFIINSLHAVWSVGAVLGGPDRRRRDLSRHSARRAAVGRRGCVQRGLPGGLPIPAARRRPRAGAGDRAPRRGRGAAVYLALAALVGIAVAGAVIEDAGSSWATLYLRDSLAAPAALAALGYVAVVGFQFVGRLLGDRLADRFGQRAVVRAGGVIAAPGWAPRWRSRACRGPSPGSPRPGSARPPWCPAAMHAADELPGLRPGNRADRADLADAGRVPGLADRRGTVADAVSLRAGLLTVPVAGTGGRCPGAVLSARGSGQLDREHAADDQRDAARPSPGSAARRTAGGR